MANPSVETWRCCPQTPWYPFIYFYTNGTQTSSSTYTTQALRNALLLDTTLQFPGPDWTASMTLPLVGYNGLPSTGDLQRSCVLFSFSLDYDRRSVGAPTLVAAARTLTCIEQ